MSEDIHLDRRTKLAAFLRTLPAEEWDYSTFVSRYSPQEKHPCGTCCCAAGWLPKILPNDWRWVESGCTLVPMRIGGRGGPNELRLVDMEDVAEFLGIDELAAEEIFTSAHVLLDREMEEVTPSDIADLLMTATRTQ
jgi:hypothetical protein